LLPWFVLCLSKCFKSLYCRTLFILLPPDYYTPPTPIAVHVFYFLTVFYLSCLIDSGGRLRLFAAHARARARAVMQGEVGNSLTVSLSLMLSRASMIYLNGLAIKGKYSRHIIMCFSCNNSAINLL